MEWKRGGRRLVAALRYSLETFLGGMETRDKGVLVAALLALKPSLVEWKLCAHVNIQTRSCPLKPSLVEWKPATRTGGVPGTIP